MSAGAGTPSDWVSGERVFAPPNGTVDVDWLVPAVLELVPGATPVEARAALEQAWLRRRGSRPQAGAPGAAPGAVPAASVPAASAPAEAVPAETAEAAERVLDEALTTFGG